MLPRLPITTRTTLTSCRSHPQINPSFVHKISPCWRPKLWSHYAYSFVDSKFRSCGTSLTFSNAIILPSRQRAKGNVEIWGFVGNRDTRSTLSWGRQLFNAPAQRQHGIFESRHGYFLHVDTNRFLEVWQRNCYRSLDDSQSYPSFVPSSFESSRLSPVIVGRHEAHLVCFGETGFGILFLHSLTI